MTTYLDRYLRGERERVWEELLTLGSAINQEPLWGEASAVAKETMLRVRANVERITARLYAIGYAFGVYPDGRTKVFGYTQPFHPPAETIEQEICDLEQLHGVGKLPLSLKYFWQFVGDVDWMGYHPHWPAFSDPLVVYPIAAARSEYEDWRFTISEGLEDEGEFGVPIAPDALHKDNVSGGPPYMIMVPNSAIDAIVLYEKHQTTFVNYLRICFAYGGFPGVQWSNIEIPRALAALSHDLIPI
jgi:hypothetical protein